MAEIKDSGKTREFDTGAHRDAAEGKGRTDLLPLRYVIAAHRAAGKNAGGILKDNAKLSVQDIQRLLEISADEVMAYVNDLKEGRGDEPSKILTAIYNTAVCAGIIEDRDSHDIIGGGTASQYFWYGMLQVSKHYEAGALKYGENNWQHGMPLHVYIDSALRHTMKALAGMEDEPHIRAACWNLLCFLWTKDNISELNDLSN